MISTETQTNSSALSFFENLPDLIRPSVAASQLGLSIDTIYNWHYRRKNKKIPADLFVKLNRLLYVRTSSLRDWIASQNSSLP